MTSTTQYEINQYLRSIGLDPVDAVLGTMLDLTYLIPNFLSRGGTLKDAMKVYRDSDDWYPTPMMEASYDSKYLIVRRDVCNGYPVIELHQPNDEGVWTTILVHPDHLDVTLCHVLDVPELPTLQQQ
jgi:hypothetical protein